MLGVTARTVDGLLSLSEDFELHDLRAGLQVVGEDLPLRGIVLHRDLAPQVSGGSAGLVEACLLLGWFGCLRALRFQLSETHLHGSDQRVSLRTVAREEEQLVCKHACRTVCERWECMRHLSSDAGRTHGPS
jgi:hypothetical protein